MAVLQLSDIGPCALAGVVVLVAAIVFGPIGVRRLEEGPTTPPLGAPEGG